MEMCLPMEDQGLKVYWQHNLYNWTCLWVANNRKCPQFADTWTLPLFQWMHDNMVLKCITQNLPLKRYMDLYLFAFYVFAYFDINKS